MTVADSVGHVRAAESHNPPLVGELDNGTHIDGSAVVRSLPGQRTPCLDAPASVSPQLSRMQG